MTASNVVEVSSTTSTPATTTPAIIGKYKGYLPFLLTTLLFLGVTLPLMRTRSEVYSYTTDTSGSGSSSSYLNGTSGGSTDSSISENTTTTALASSVVIFGPGEGRYPDTGFNVAPHWGSSSSDVGPQWINNGYALGYLALLIVWGIINSVVVGRRGDDGRGVAEVAMTMLRRFLLCLSVGQLLQFLQMWISVFPEPNTNPSFLQATRGGPDGGGWCFYMHPILYCTGGLMVHFYSLASSSNTGTTNLASHQMSVANIAVIGVAYALSAFGCGLVTATHLLLTIDLLGAMIATIFPFLVYHWGVRSSEAVEQLVLPLRWLEQDALPFLPAKQSQHSATADHQSSEPIHSSSSASSPPPPSIVIVERSSATEEVEEEDEPAAATATSANDNQETSSANTAQEIIILPSQPPRFSLNVFHVPFCTLEEVQRHRGILADRVALLCSDKERYLRHLPGLGVAVIVAAAAGVGNVVAVAHTNDNRPDPLTTDLSLDVLFPILPTVYSRTPDIFLYSQIVVVAILTLIFCPQRLTVLRRTGITYGLVMALRCFTVPATLPPDPSPLCQTRELDPGVTCGDLIFSGHTVAFCLSYFVVRHYRSPRFWWAEIICLLWTVVGLVTVVASKLHYTRDVITALLVCPSIFYLAHAAFFWRLDRRVRWAWLYWVEFDDSYYAWRVQVVEAEKKEAEERDNNNSNTEQEVERSSDTTGGGSHNEPISLQQEQVSEQ